MKMSSIALLCGTFGILIGCGTKGPNQADLELARQNLNSAAIEPKDSHGIWMDQATADSLRSYRKVPDELCGQAAQAHQRVTDIFAYTRENEIFRFDPYRPRKPEDTFFQVHNGKLEAAPGSKFASDGQKAHSYSLFRAGPKNTRIHIHTKDAQTGLETDTDEVLSPMTVAEVRSYISLEDKCAKIPDEAPPPPPPPPPAPPAPPPAPVAGTGTLTLRHGSQSEAQELSPAKGNPVTCTTVGNVFVIGSGAGNIGLGSFELDGIVVTLPFSGPLGTAPVTVPLTTADLNGTRVVKLSEGKAHGAVYSGSCQVQVQAQSAGTIVATVNCPDATRTVTATHASTAVTVHADLACAQKEEE